MVLRNASFLNSRINGRTPFHTGGAFSMIGMVAGDGSDADGDVKNIPTGPYEEVGVCAPLNFFGNFY